MVSVWGLHCSVCEITFDTRKEWCSHLLQSNHQNRSRVECLSWDLKVKECVLVAFAKFPVAREDVLYCFTLRERNTIVTDFVWSDHRPRVGIIQFESRHKAEEVLEESGRKPVLIDNQLIQLRRASDYLELEWDELLERFHPESECSNSTKKGGVKRKRLEDENEDTSTPVDKEIRERLDGPLVPFHSQFQAICDEIGIPDKEFNSALEIMEKCRLIFSARYPTCKLYMFRHWYLKLWSQGSNELLFYLDANGQLENNEAATTSDYVKPFTLGASDINKFLTSPSAKQILPGVRHLQNREEDWESRAFQFQHEPSGLKFSIVADSLFTTEVQTCRLVKYLWEFDPRVRPFFILMYYWEKKNFVRISEKIYMDPVKSHAFAPEPAGLEWMIITFLAQKGIIPKPYEILGRPHKQLLLFQKSDIGFEPDHQFSREWAASRPQLPEENSNEFYHNVVELIKEFFSFYGKLRRGAWIVNTRDAEVISRQDFFHKPHVELQLQTRLTNDEICELKRVGIKYSLTQVDLQRWMFSLLHPLFVGWTIMFHNQRFYKTTSRLMMVSADYLEEGIKDCKINGSSTKGLQKMLRRVRSREGQEETRSKMDETEGDDTN